jgi:hypothetical protein
VITHLDGKSWVWWCILIIPAIAGRINRRIEVQARLRKHETLSPK